jgi:hypothetical protein
MRWLSQGLPLVAGLLLALPTLAQTDVRLTTLSVRAEAPSLASGPYRVSGRALPSEALVSGAVTIWASAEPLARDLSPVVEPAGPPPAAVAPVSAALPAEVALRAVYPNPLAGRARIPYELPVAATVRLTVYDALGRQVAVLADGPAEAGFHEASLDAARLAPGVYHVRLAVDAYVGAARFTVVR